MIRLWRILLITFLFSGPAWAAPKTFCVWDVVGAAGDFFNLMKTYQLEALNAGQQIELKAYRDELRVVEDFRAGRCDMIAVTDLQARRFNRFTGSVSAIGAVPYYDDLKIVMHILASRRAVRRLDDGEFKIMGMVPQGGMYLFVKDRNITTVEDLRGLRFTVLPNHKDAEHMVKFVGGKVVPAEVTNFASLFNDGQADVSYAPAVAYEVLEMYKGMGPNGGIVRYPLGQFSMQLIARSDEFDDKFTMKSRQILADMYEASMKINFRYERTIPEERWIDIGNDAIAEYQEMLRGVRLDLAKQPDHEVGGVYHPAMMSMLRKVRCHTNPGAVECYSAERE